MFGKKCQNCNAKIGGKYHFCPDCGKHVPHKGKDQDWGILGKEDTNNFENEIQFPKGFGMIFNSLMKNFEKQFKDFDHQLNQNFSNQPKPNLKRGGISISISTSGNGPPQIKVNSLGNNFQEREIKVRRRDKTKEKALPSKSLNISKLKKEEPSTNIRRLSDKVIYEINMPGVKSIKDLSIVKLEKSIEIKAIAGKKAYVKLIPINLPVSNYNFSNGKLVLELEAKS